APPSDNDLFLAVDAVEYLLEADGIYAYNRNGLVNTQPLTENEMVAILKTAEAPEASSVEARAVLNRFIAAIDEYNTEREDFELFRSAMAPLTDFTNNVYPPVVGTFNSVKTVNGQSVPTASASINQTSTSQFSVTYDVTTSGSYAGAVIDLDPTFADATKKGATQDLSSLSKIVFNATPPTSCSAAKSEYCFTVEVKDRYWNATLKKYTNHVSRFFGTDFVANGTEQQMQILTSDLVADGLDLQNIQEIVINFTDNAYGTGWKLVNKNATMNIKTSGLYFEPQVSGVGTGPVTDLSGYGVAPGVIEKNGTDTIVGDLNKSTGQFSFTYSIPAKSGNWGGGILVFSKVDANNVPVRPDLTSNDLVFQVSGTSKIRVSVSDALQIGTNADGTPVYRSVTLVFTGLSETNGFVKITKADLQAAAANFGFAAITSVAFVVDENTAPATSGTVTVKSSGLYFEPPVGVGTGTITDFDPLLV
ncbi:MAG TPA: hypothetical protein PKI45_08285, partial [Candidatus Omnitrophota bacterium]|nr:hypothetical protein [Candidatus Omnitrophota bacterium]